MKFVGQAAPAFGAREWMSSYRDLFPSVLTLALFMVYGSTIITGVELAIGTHSRFWIGPWGYLVLLIPLLVVGSHIAQAHVRRPIYFAVLASCAIPPLLSLLLGYFYMTPLMDIVDRLQSTDCVTFQKKLVVEQAYKQALSFYDDCAAAQAKNASKSIEAVKKELVISQCPGYNPQESGYASEWAYLQSLEQQEACSGWCFKGETALWTSNPSDWDSCSLAAAQNIKEQVVRNSWRMVVNGMIGCVMAGTAILLIQEWMNRARSMGADIAW